MTADELRGYLQALDEVSEMLTRAATVEFARGWVAGRTASRADDEGRLGLVDWDELNRDGGPDV